MKKGGRVLSWLGMALLVAAIVGLIVWWEEKEARPWAREVVRKAWIPLGEGPIAIGVPLNYGEERVLRRKGNFIGVRFETEIVWGPGEVEQFTRAGGMANLRVETDDWWFQGGERVLVSRSLTPEEVDRLKKSGEVVWFPIDKRNLRKYVRVVAHPWPLPMMMTYVSVWVAEKPELP